MHYGRIKWINEEKGYGFISYKNGEDIFVHSSTINNFKELKKGQLVCFKFLNTIKGYQAIEVTLVKESHVKGMSILLK